MISRILPLVTAPFSAPADTSKPFFYFQVMCAATQIACALRGTMAHQIAPHISAFAGGQAKAGKQGGTGAIHTRDHMKTTFSNKQLKLAVACALALGFASNAAHAQNFGPNDVRELWTDTPKQQVWKNGYGECWHSAFGPPPGYNECNPAPVAQYVAPTPPPVIVAPPPPRPAPAPVVEPAPLPPRKTRG